MNDSLRKQQRHGFVGICSGLFVGWFCFALALRLFWHLGQTDYLSRYSSFFLLVGAVFLLLPMFPIVGFAMGMTCAFFWRGCARKEQLESWRLWVLIPFFLPLFSLGLINGVASICIVAPMMVKPFNRGINFGVTWWGERRWRHFVGLSLYCGADDGQAVQSRHQLWRHLVGRTPLASFCRPLQRLGARR